MQLIAKAQNELKKKGYDVRVVSIPSFDRFNAQSREYQESVLPSNVRKRLAVEMAASFGWERYVGLDGTVLGIDRFGASAPGDTIIENFGFTVDNVVKHAENLMNS